MKFQIMGDNKSNIIPIKRPNQKKLNARELLSQQIRMRFCSLRLCEDDSDDDDDSADLECEREGEREGECECDYAKPDLNDKQYNSCSAKSENEIIKKESEQKFDMNEKESIMKMIGTQNFIEGFWEENEYTKKIKEKYQKEYDLIKGIKNKNMNDIIAITIIIIYFIHKENPNLISELIIIIKKAKKFILKKTKESYDNIIKEIGLN